MNTAAYQLMACRTECDQERSAYNLKNNHPLSTRLLHATIGLQGEVGELAGAIERWLYYNQPLDSVNVVEELGDCLWYIALACNALGVPMADVMDRNIAKLVKRFPEKYTELAAVEENRNRKAERAVLEQTGNGWAEPPFESES
jgi:NTP pyrophosphatase (non-canonical NTP hydrolase)